MTRLRALMEQPVDPEVARWVVSLALLVTVGLACLVALSAAGRSATRPREEAHGAGPFVEQPPVFSLPDDRRSQPRRQDPQDRPGTAAHRRAERELVTHRALQYVPWRGDGVSISLVGARKGRAVLEVRGPDTEAARRGYREFLHRYDDDGDAYFPRFRHPRRPDGRPSARRQGVDPAVAPTVDPRVDHAVTPREEARAESPRRAADLRARRLPRSPRHDKAVP